MAFLSPGAIHIHTIHSDGTGTVKEIARAAKKNGLDWIVITDHNNMDAKEGIYEGVCVIVGEEISPPTENHYLALDIKTPISCEMHVADYIKEVKRQGGFGFIAHPDAKELRQNSYIPLRWSDWDIKDFGGIEIWNYMSNWGDYYNEKNVFNIMKAYLFRNRVLSGPTEKVLEFWDNSNNETQHIVPAIGGVDVHAVHITRAFVTLKIFPYKNILGTITNFINLENPMPADFENRKKAILEAIKSGKNIIMNRAWGRNGASANFYIQNKDKKAYAGGLIGLDDCSTLVVELPLKAKIRVVHNGKVISQKVAKTLELEVGEKGKYRIEAYFKNRPWIFSNPIIVN